MFKDMTNVMKQLHDEGTHKVILYVDSDSYLCTDTDKTVKATKALVDELFEKGMLLVQVTSGPLVVPTDLTSGGSGANAYAIVKYWGMTAGASPTAAQTSLYSKEYTAG